MSLPVVVQIDFDEALTMDPAEIRSLISQLEAQLENAPQMEVPTFHHFSKGVYAREMRLKKGTLVIGKIHKHENLNILSGGEASVLSVSGCVRVKAPFTAVADPGAKRVIYAHEDLVWTTIHGTDLKDIDAIEAEFIAKTYDEVVSIDQEKKEELGEGI